MKSSVAKISISLKYTPRKVNNNILNDNIILLVYQKEWKKNEISGIFYIKLN